MAGRAAVVVLVAMAAERSRPPPVRSASTWPSWSGPTDEPCPQTKVEITVTPELAEAVSAVVQPLQGSRLADGHCIDPVVASQTAPEIVRKSEMLPAERAPQLWIPESSLWERQLERWALQSELSPLPLVWLQRAVVARLGGHGATWARHSATSDRWRCRTCGACLRRVVLGLEVIGRTSALPEA
jgi:hypothetical protein